MGPPQFSCGFDYPVVRDITECLRETLDAKYHFICAPIVHPRFRRLYNAGNPTQYVFTRSDMLLDPQEWNFRVVAKISPYLDVDSSIPSLRQQHEDAMAEEFNHYRSLSVSTVTIKLKHGDNINLARIIHNQLQFLHTSPIWVEVPMEDPHLHAFEQNPNTEPMKTDEIGTWGWWSTLHSMTEWNRKVYLSLRLSPELPDQEDLDRWLGEPIKCVVLPTSIFVTNKKGFPVLSRAHQQFIRNVMSRDVHFVVSGAVRHADRAHYLQYLEHLWNNREISTRNDPVTSFAKGWEDHLQMPLQPLSDNLDAHTYHIFEKDPVKYDAYQAATVAALRDRYPEPPECRGKKINLKEIDTKSSVKLKLGKETVTVLENGDVIRNLNSSGEVSDDSVDGMCPNFAYAEDGALCGCRHSAVIMVLGAGRGPLVRAAINAATIAKVDVTIYAIEKNPGALQTLFAQQREIWKEQVTVVATDMREFRPTELADIIISELLGSFGDNELSPECLDGARHVLKPDGISIPSSYTSYIAPVMSARLWGHIREWGDTAQGNPLLPGGGINGGKPSNFNMETLWVVYLQNKYSIAKPQALFTFNHPNKSSHPDNRRWSRVTFDAVRSCTLHGFSGYFDCVLYGDYKLSILPDEHSKDMISWFPVFCPIKFPLRIKAGDKVSVDFWRCVSQNRCVWYEWCVTSPELQVAHNLGGRSSNMIL